MDTILFLIYIKVHRKKQAVVMNVYMVVAFFVAANAMLLAFIAAGKVAAIVLKLEYMLATKSWVLMPTVVVVAAYGLKYAMTA